MNVVYAGSYSRVYEKKFNIERKSPLSLLKNWAWLQENLEYETMADEDDELDLIENAPSRAGRALVNLNDSCCFASTNVECPTNGQAQMAKSGCYSHSKVCLDVF